MRHQGFTAYVAAVALVIGGGSLAAQDARPAPQGARPNPSGSSTGEAVARPSGGGGSAGGATGSSSGGSTTGARPGGSDAGGASHRPAHDAQSIPTPRGDRRGDRTTAASASADDSGRRAVPVTQGARPRDGRPTVGTAVGRTTPPVRGDRGGSTFYDPYYRYSYYYNAYPYGYYWPGYGLGVGYFYDPWMWGSPYGYYDPYYYGGYGAGGSYRSGYARQIDLGAVRLKVKPSHAQVFVDGYYVGEVDDFDGVFQRLPLEAGPRRIEIRAPGFEPAQFEVLVTPGQTITYKGDLRRE